MKLSPGLLLLPLLFLSAASSAETGEALHQSHCTECHSRMTGGDGHVLYSRDDRIAKNESELKQRISHCAKGANTGWDEIQINAVFNYLNEKYYHY